MDIFTINRAFLYERATSCHTNCCSLAYYKMPKKTKEQTDQIISELNDVKKQIKDVQITADENNAKIDEVQAKLKLHDDAHLVTMRMRLDRDIRRAIRRGFTTKMSSM